MRGREEMGRKKSNTYLYFVLAKGGVGAQIDRSRVFFIIIMFSLFSCFHVFMFFVIFELL